MKASIAVELILVQGTGMAAAKDAPMIPDMQGADLGAYPSDIGNGVLHFMMTNARPRTPSKNGTGSLSGG